MIRLPSSRTFIHSTTLSLFPMVLSAMLAAIGQTSARTAESTTVCSLVPFGRLKRDSQPYFIGSAQFDTMAAGPGTTRFNLGTGHFGRSRDRPIYGQIVHVEKWSVNQPGLQAPADSTVVVVPWDYGADCSTTAWGGHWVWLRTGDRMFFSPILRNRQYWVNNHPTFDAFSPQFDAYPVRYEDPVMGKQFNGLTADQLFELYELLPTAEEIGRIGWEASASAATWAKEHPELARQYPAREIGMTLAWEAGDSHARKINSPLTGTYRFSLTYPSGKQREFYVRTTDMPVGAWHIMSSPREEPQTEGWMRFPDGYELRLWVAASERELPTVPDDDKEYDFELGIRESGISTRDSTVWRGDFATEGLDDLEVLKDPELDELMSQHDKWFFAWYDSGTVSPDPGRFVRYSDGRVTFEQPLKLADSTEVMLRAVRVSRKAIRDTVCYKQSC